MISQRNIFHSSGSELHQNVSELETRDSTHNVSMLESRAFAASVVLNESTLWVTGGLGLGYQGLNSTELVNLNENKSFESSIKLPINLQLHCLIKINEKQVMLVGGLSFNGPEARTYLFDFDTMTWYPGFNLTYPRYGHSCGLFKKGGSATAVVVGGSNPVFAFVQKSVEMLDLEMVGYGIQWYHGKQSHYIEVPHESIFMEQNMRHS
jgi:hypothetical protein